MRTRGLSAGSLPHRITIQTPTRTPDNRGGVTNAWGTHVTAWASVKPISAREAYQRGAVAGEVRYAMRLRYQSGIVPKMRVSWNSRVFRILGVRNVDEMNTLLELECVEEPV